MSAPLRVDPDAPGLWLRVSGDSATLHHVVQVFGILYVAGIVNALSGAADFTFARLPRQCFGVGRRVALYLRDVRTDIHLAGTPAEIRALWSRGSVELAFADEVERLRAAYVEGYLADPLPTIAVVRARAVAALQGAPAAP